jgi:hypothetical protein
MNPIAAFLARYKGIRPPTEIVAKQLIEAIEKVVGPKVDVSQIEIRRKTAFIRGSASLKSEIALKQKDILAYVQAQGGTLEELR